MSKPSNVLLAAIERSIPHASEYHIFVDSTKRSAPQLPSNLPSHLASLYEYIALLEQQNKESLRMATEWHQLFTDLAVDLCRLPAGQGRIVETQTNELGHLRAATRPQVTAGDGIDLAPHIPHFLAAWPASTPLPGWLAAAHARMTSVKSS